MLFQLIKSNFSHFQSIVIFVVMFFSAFKSLFPMEISLIFSLFPVMIGLQYFSIFNFCPSPIFPPSHIPILYLLCKIFKFFPMLFDFDAPHSLLHQAQRLLPPKRLLSLAFASYMPLALIYSCSAYYTLLAFVYPCSAWYIFALDCYNS